MGYKLKRILIYPDGVTEKQVYPASIYNYSYDFRNKTTATMEADGWIFFLNKNTATFNSYGITCSSADVALMAKIENLASIMPSANKVILSLTGMYSGKNANRFSLYNTATSSTRSGVTGHWVGNSTNQIQTTIYGSNTTESATVSGDITVTTVLDLVNGTWTTTSTAGYSGNGTIDSTAISNIRNNIKGFYISPGWTYEGNNTGALTTINLTIY